MRLMLIGTILLLGCSIGTQEKDRDVPQGQRARLPDASSCGSAQMVMSLLYSDAVSTWVDSQYGNWISGAWKYPPQMERILLCGEACVPELVRSVTGDSNARARTAACHLLGGIAGRSFGCDCAAFLPGSKVACPSESLAAKWASWWERNAGRTRYDWLVEGLQDPTDAKASAIELGFLGDVRALEPLRAILATSNRELGFAVVVSLARLGDTTVVPRLVELLLTHEMAVFRREGIRLLKELTGQDMEYDPDAPLVKRKEAIRRWKQWLRQHK